MRDRHEERPASWLQLKKRIKHRSLFPFYVSEWLCEWGAFYLRRWAFLDILEYIGKLAVLIAVGSYVLGANDRRIQRDKDAWQIINMAYRKSGNAGRSVALEELHRDKESLAEIDLSEAWLVGINLEGADLHGGSFDNSDLSKANLSHASLARANLRTALLNEANLRNSDLSEAKMPGAHFADADLRGADLSVTHLEGAVLSGADLTGAKLYNAFLVMDGDTATLAIRANLSRVDFRYAHLNGLDVEGARFDHADLREVDFTYVRNLTQKQIDSAIVDDTTRLPAGLQMPRSTREIRLPPQ